MANVNKNPLATIKHSVLKGKVTEQQLEQYKEDFYNTYDNPKYLGFLCLKHDCKPYELLEKLLPSYIVDRIKNDPKRRKEYEKFTEQNRKIIESLDTPKVKKQLKNIAWNRTLKEGLDTYENGIKRHIDGIEEYILKYEIHKQKLIKDDPAISKRSLNYNLKKQFGHNIDWATKSAGTIWRNIPKYWQEMEKARIVANKNELADEMAGLDKLKSRRNLDGKWQKYYIKDENGNLLSEHTQRKRILEQGHEETITDYHDYDIQAFRKELHEKFEEVKKRFDRFIKRHGKNRSILN